MKDNPSPTAGQIAGRMTAEHVKPLVEYVEQATGVKLRTNPEDSPVEENASEYPDNVVIGGMPLNLTDMRETFAYYANKQPARHKIRTVETAGDDGRRGYRWELLVDGEPRARGAGSFSSRQAARRDAMDILPVPQLVGGY